jgi:hypothetical protein
LLTLLDGALIDRIPFRYAARCPEGHEGRGAGAFDVPLDTMTIDAFRQGAEATVAALHERCAACRAPIGDSALTDFFAFYEFEDGAGTAVAWYGRGSGGRGWQFGYAPQAGAEALVAADLGRMVPSRYGGIKNEDCRAVLGRVFSLRNRWPELVGHYLGRGRTIVGEIVAPGYACFVVRADCPAQVRALARVTLAEYRPDETHIHARLDPARLPRNVAEETARQNLVLEAVVDTDWVVDQIERQSARLGRDGGGLDPRRIAADAAASARLIGEQVIRALARAT